MMRQYNRISNQATPDPMYNEYYTDTQNISRSIAAVLNCPAKSTRDVLIFTQTSLQDVFIKFLSQFHLLF